MPFCAARNWICHDAWPKCRHGFYELTEFLIDVLGVEDVGAHFPETVMYHPTCHGRRLSRSAIARCGSSAQLTASVYCRSPTTTSVADLGTFAVKNEDTSLAMGTDKVNDVVSTGASVLAAADTSCLMHIGGLLLRRKEQVRAITSSRSWRPMIDQPSFADTPPFPEAAREALANGQLRTNLKRATNTIRDKRARAVAERPDWEELRLAGAAIKDEVLSRLPEPLLQLEDAVMAAGGIVHWARDGAEAGRSWPPSLRTMT